MLFTTIHQLLTKIHETRSKKTLHQLELAFMKYDIAISDELGYVTLTKESADMIFNLLGIVNFARTEEKTDKQKNNSLLFTNRQVKYEFIDTHRYRFNILKMAQCLKISVRFPAKLKGMSNEEKRLFSSVCKNNDVMESAKELDNYLIAEIQL